MPSTPTLSIIIVSWNVRDHLRRCLASIAAQVRISHEVIVIDNASTDGTCNMIHGEFSGVRVVANTKNVGFATANNQGLQLARGEWLAILNPDTELDQDAFTPLITYAGSQSAVAAVGPELLNSDHTHQASVRRFPTLSDQLITLLKLRQVLRWTPVMRKYLADPGAGVRTPLEVDQIMGACMIIPRAAVERIGMFDDGYPNWFEEVDWCRRAKLAGWRIVYAPLSQVVHHGGTSFGQVLSIAKHRWVLTGLRRYAKKFWPTWQYAVIFIASGVSYALTILQTVVKPR